MTAQRNVGFGIDLAGYTTGRTSFAAVVNKDDYAEAIIFEGSVFSIGKKFSSASHLSEILAAEAETIQCCLKLGKVAVDVPIDLQNLRNPINVHRLWELTRRPIDKALNALPPLADRIGASVARFQAILDVGNFGDLLGVTLFETYPEGIWKIMGIDSKGYKKTDKTLGATRTRKNMCGILKITSELQSDHDIDAIVSAITANATAAYIYSEEEFAELLAKRLDSSNRYRIPKGYRLLKKVPYQYIHVRRENFKTWVAREV